MSDQPETVPAIDPEPVDLGYLGDRARAYVVGLEARLKRLRTENDDLRAQLNDPARTDEKHIKAAYKLALADGLIDAKGAVDWDALKGAYPELFAQPKPAAPPNTNAGAKSAGVEKTYGGLSLRDVAKRYNIRAPQ